MGVIVDSGELPSAEGKDGHQLAQVVRKWRGVASLHFPKDCSDLLKMIQETDRLKLWEKNCGGFTYQDRDEFLRKEVLIDYDLTEENFKAIVTALKGGDTKGASDELTKSQQKAERNREIRERYKEPGVTQQKLAADYDLTERQVRAIIKADEPEKVDRTTERLPVRDSNLGRVYLCRDPAAAAAKIREKFGEEYAAALKASL